jgi:hypothetical protein
MLVAKRRSAASWGEKTTSLMKRSLSKRRLGGDEDEFKDSAAAKGAMACLRTEAR